MCLPAGLIETILLNVMKADVFGRDPVHPVALLGGVFIAIALVEEALKYVVLKWCARKDHNIDEPFDWIVYAVSISMGFALFENVLYVVQGGYFTGVLRAFTAVPEHALCATLMGDRLARAAVVFQSESDADHLRRSARQRRLAVIEPALWHGFYDLFAIGSHRAGISGHGLLSMLLTAALIGLLIIQWRIAFGRVRIQQLNAHLHRFVPPLLVSRRFLRK